MLASALGPREVKPGGVQSWACPPGMVRSGNACTPLAVPANVRLHYLPSCTPELQPAERLWPLLRESLANAVVNDVPSLAARLTARADWMANRPDVVGGVIGYHWAIAA